MYKFKDLHNALEAKVKAQLVKLEEYAVKQNAESLAEVCADLISPTYESFTVFFPDLERFEGYSESHHHMSQSRYEELYDEYCKALPIEFEFAQDYRMEPFDTTLSVYSQDSLLFRTAIALPDIENCGEDEEFDDNDQVCRIISRLTNLLKTWDLLHRGVHYETSQGLPAFNFIEQAFLQLLEGQSRGTIDGGKTTQEEAERRHAKILAKAEEFDPEKKRTANALAIDLVNELKIPRKKGIPNARGEVLSAKDTSYSLRGFKKTSILKVLKKNGWG